MRGRACGGAGGHGLWISPTGRAPVRRLCWTNWNFLKPGAGIRCARGWRTCCTGGTAVPGAARWTSWAAAGWTAAFLPPGSPGRNRGDALRRLSGPGESKGQGGGLLGKKRLSPFWQTKTRERVLRDYVEGCFGASLLSPGELAQAEQELCTGDHRNCRLHFTKGEPISRPVKGACARERALFELQRQKNRAYFEEHKGQYRLAMARLSQALENTLLLQREEDDSPSRWGAFGLRRPGGRSPGGGADLYPPPDPGAGELWVDLLLDGSASQNGQQENLAAQAYLIAASLGRCQIPVRVSSFCSVSGCTVLRVYRDYQDKGTDEKIFDYAAARMEPGRPGPAGHGLAVGPEQGGRPAAAHRPLRRQPQ